MRIRALGLTRGICGWSEATLEASDFGSLLAALPTELEALVKKGDILVMINGAESSSLGVDSLKMKDDDEVVLLPVVHGGKR